jgi:hypothetical protein
VDLAYHASDGDVIEAEHFIQELEGLSRQEELRRIPLVQASNLLTRMSVEHGSFWTVVYRPYMDRELSRSEVRDTITAGLTRTRGSYKKLLGLFNIEPGDYLKFMDFLRHQKLKPEP